MRVANEKISSYKFLDEMYRDGYFPNNLVDKGRGILLELCLEIEKKRPVSPAEVYKLTHTATEKFNRLALEFEAQGSEIETAARENIGMDIEFILKAYGYDLDLEEAIAPRNW
ncbi:hypothetical protein FKG94_24075 [Exilibacterium tricleocarpae]|uniref:Uncharacterized protein n=1 Tax=Exilibacterium tricleocarpae TaxID=2591008 RepID=A0A545STA8_9GAMM|nr:hypothetical protein FKG94_24075 [Exilibacterium tricleocarpae]